MANYTMELNEVVSRLADGKTLGGGEERFPINRTIFPNNYNITYIRGKADLHTTSASKVLIVYPNSFKDRNYDYDIGPDRAITNSKNNKNLYSYIDHLEQKILLHYWFREIGVETIDKFIIMFRREFTENLQRINMKYKDSLMCLNYLPNVISNLEPFRWANIHTNGCWVWGNWEDTNHHNIIDAMPFDDRLIVPTVLTTNYEDNAITHVERTQVNDKAVGSSQSTSNGNSESETANSNTDIETVTHEGKTKRSDTPYTQLSDLDNYNTNIDEDSQSDHRNNNSAGNVKGRNKTTANGNVNNTADRDVITTVDIKNNDINRNDFAKYLLEGTELLSRIEDELIESLEGCFLQIF